MADVVPPGRATVEVQDLTPACAAQFASNSVVVEPTPRREPAAGETMTTVGAVGTT